MLKFFKIKNWFKTAGCLALLLVGASCLSNYGVNRTFADETSVATENKKIDPVQLKEEVLKNLNNFMRKEYFDWTALLFEGISKNHPDILTNLNEGKVNITEYVATLFESANFGINYFSDSADANVASNLENVSCVSEVLKFSSNDSSEADVFSLSLLPNANEEQYNALKSLKDSDLSKLKLQIVDANTNEVLGLGGFFNITDMASFKENDPRPEKMVETAKYVILNVYNKNTNTESQIAENSAAYNNILERLKQAVTFTGYAVVKKDKINSNSKLRYDFVAEDGKEIKASFEVPSIGVLGKVEGDFITNVVESIASMFN